MTLVPLVVLLVGCQRAEVAPPPLPDFHAGGFMLECPDWLPDPLNAAVWAETADSLIVGTVAEVRAVGLPFMESTGIREPEECSGRLLPSLQVTLDDVVTYAGGNLDGERVVLTFGHYVLTSVWQHDWGVTIIAKDDSSVEWLDEGRGRITLGQRVGIDMLCDPHFGYCGNMARPLFMLDEHDRVRFQEIPRSSCHRAPEGLEGIHVGELADVISEARATAADLEALVVLRRGLESDSVESRLSRFRHYFASGCLIEEAACDPLCAPDELCVDGECLSDEPSHDEG